MGRSKAEEHHFLTIENTGRYSILTPLSGQTLKKEPLRAGVMVKGCEKYRKSFPVGSVFGTTTLKKVHHRSSYYYQVKDLYFLGETDPYTDLVAETTRQQLITEYKTKLIN